MVKVDGSGGSNTWLWNVFLAFLVFMFIWSVASFMTMYKQETKSFRRVHGMRLLMFTYIWMTMSLLFFFVSLMSFVLGGWKRVQSSAHYFSGRTAKIMARLSFGRVVMKGKGNIPSWDTPCVFIANHQSCADIAMAYYTDSNFRWVAKWSAFCIPGVGFIMLLCGHVPLLRRTKLVNRTSKSHMLKACHDKLKEGLKVFIFPQGTRERANLLDFKHGAFTLAIDANVPIVPVTIDLPVDLWFNSQTPPVMTIHPPIYPDDPAFKERDVLMKKCFHIIMDNLSYGPELLKMKEKVEKERKLHSSSQGGKKLE